MGRYVAEYTIGQPDDFIRLVSEDYFQKEGFKLVPYKGEMLWKKGRGVLTAPQYIKLAYGQGIVHVEAFIRWTILPGVYVGEMALDNGFVGAIPKSMLMDKVNTLLRLLSQPMPAAAPAGGPMPAAAPGAGAPQAAVPQPMPAPGAPSKIIFIFKLLPSVCFLHRVFFSAPGALRPRGRSLFSYFKKPL